jgi:hypothetical protein
MSRHTYVSAGALALSLIVAGVAPLSQAESLPPAKPQASRAIILAAEPAPEPGVPRGAKCALWGPSGHGKWRCVSFCYPRYERC